MSRRGDVLDDTPFLVLMNAHYGAVPFRLPGPELGLCWKALVDTTYPLPFGEDRQPLYRAGEIYPLQGRALVILTQSDVCPRRGAADPSLPPMMFKPEME